MTTSPATLEPHKGPGGPRPGSGRPSILTVELAERICEHIASGHSIRTIERMEGMPGKSAIFSWLARHSWFAERYALAREAQADAMAEEILDIADDSAGDFKVDAEGNTVVDHENIQRARLRVDARKWLMAKMRPSRYGDRLNLDATVTSLPAALDAIRQLPEDGDDPPSDPE